MMISRIRLQRLGSQSRRFRRCLPSNWATGQNVSPPTSFCPSPLLFSTNLAGTHQTAPKTASPSPSASGIPPSTRNPRTPGLSASAAPSIRQHHSSRKLEPTGSGMGRRAAHLARSPNHRSVLLHPALREP
jgi:hypothetical protein